MNILFMNMLRGLIWKVPPKERCRFIVKSFKLSCMSRIFRRFAIAWAPQEGLCALILNECKQDLIRFAPNLHVFQHPLGPRLSRRYVRCLETVAPHDAQVEGGWQEIEILYSFEREAIFRSNLLPKSVPQVRDGWPENARVAPRHRPGMSFRGREVGVHKRLGTNEVAACQLAQRNPPPEEYLATAMALLQQTPLGVPQAITGRRRANED